MYKLEATKGANWILTINHFDGTSEDFTEKGTTAPTLELLIKWFRVQGYTNQCKALALPIFNFLSKVM